MANEATDVCRKVTRELRECATIAKEKGVSSWLTALPLVQHDFALHKGDFRDAMAMR